MTKGTPSGRVIVCVLLHVKQAAQEANIALAPAADGRLSAADPPRLGADPSHKHGRGGHRFGASAGSQESK